MKSIPYIKTVLACAVIFSMTAYADTRHSDTLSEESQTIALPDHTKTAQSIESDKQVKQIAQTLESNQVDTSQMTTFDSTWSTDEVYAKLLENPEAFEQLLLQLIASSNADALRTVLPAYERYANKDQSVIDWGNALIALQEGKTDKAVQMYRAINANLPNIRLLRLQMASALYQNKQINAAKDELNKLLREQMPESERQMLTAYIEQMNRQDKWNFGVNFSFTKDDNLEDAPKVGTKIVGKNSSLSYDTPHESGTGFTYSLDADKKWSYDNKMFTSFSAGINGTAYWNNKKFNDLYATTSIGLGYQTATSEIEIAPILSKSWYGGGVRSTQDDSLKSYTDSRGVRLSGHKWINPNVMLQHSTQYTDLKYKKPYQNNDGQVYSMTNGALYAPNARQYYGAYWSLSKKDGVNPADSYKRSGVSVSWTNTWDKGITTSANIGIANKRYQAANFAGIKRHNTEYTAGVSVWKRDLSVFGLTPRVNVRTKKITSNYAFDETSDTSANISLTKTF